ncbi:MAG TPA: winged helix-turn-helix domain-containing protein [Nitrososphaera sp.]|nr:winged helix-turn-helix domain-containing protein [Nitrososphaera sp.]
MSAPFFEKAEDVDKNNGKKKKQTSHRRSRYEIYADMLNAAIEPSKRTKIMYKAYVNAISNDEYLTDLLRRGFLEYDKSKRMYKTTILGREFVHKYADLDI